MSSVEHDERKYDGGDGDYDPMPHLDANMHLADWLAEQQQLLERFASYWADNHKYEPNSYPIEQWEGDWDDQFTHFVENHL